MAALDFVDGQLVVPAIEGIPAVDDAVGPRCDGGSPEQRTDRARRKRHDEVPPLIGQRSEGCADPVDARAVSARGDVMTVRAPTGFVLLSTWIRHGQLPTVSAA